MHDMATFCAHDIPYLLYHDVFIHLSDIAKKFSGETKLV